MMLSFAFEKCFPHILWTIFLLRRFIIIVNVSLEGQKNESNQISQ